MNKDKTVETEIDKLLKKVVDIHADCIWSYDTDEYGGHGQFECREKFMALVERECSKVRLEEAQLMLDWATSCDTLGYMATLAETYLAELSPPKEPRGGNTSIAKSLGQLPNAPRTLGEPRGGE